MTDDQRAYWESYTHHIAGMLGLQAWRFKIDTEPCDDDSAASIACLYGRYHATIRLAAEWATFTPERQRQTIAHEVLHCHGRRVQDAADSVIGMLGSPAYTVFSHAHEVALEYMVDGIAEAIAPMFPLPEAA